MEETVDSFVVTIDHIPYKVLETTNNGMMRFYVPALGQELILESDENADLRPINNNTIDPDLIYAVGNAIESHLP